MNAHTVAAARRAHDALVHALRAYETAEQNVVLRFAEIYHGRLFRELGYASIYHYATEKLGLSEAKTAQFVRLAKDVQRLPRLKQALRRNEVTWTKAREIGKVATPESERQWVERAQQTSQRELAREVRQARKPRAAASGQASGQASLLASPEKPAGDPPVRYTLDLTPLQAARLQKLMERIRPGRDRAELLLDALTALVESEHAEKESLTRVKVQVAAYRCERCAGVDVPTPAGMKRLSPLDAATVACDAEHVDRQGRKRARTPAALRRKVLARDRHSCVRCGRTGLLQIHHRHRQAEGGRHTLENCVAVCAPCHRLHHAEEEALRAGVALELAAVGGLDGGNQVLGERGG